MRRAPEQPAILHANGPRKNHGPRNAARHRDVIARLDDVAVGRA